MRPIEAVVFEEAGDKRVLLQDPEQIAPSSLVLTMEAFALLQVMAEFLDGNHSVEDIAEYIAENVESGEGLPNEVLEQVIDRLEEGYFLDSKRFWEFRKSEEEAFRVADVRAHVHAGQAYPAQPKALTNQLESYFNDPPAGAEHYEGTRVSGLVLPHLDLRHAGSSCAVAWSAVRDNPPDRIVILGVNHNGPPVPYIFTHKNFSSPMGTLETDRSFVDAVAESVGRDLCEGEIAHRQEHSIEFAALFVQHVFPDAEIPIVPVLCSSLLGLMLEDKDPGESPDHAPTLDAIRDTLNSASGHTLVVSSVDLSHVGPKFGDPEPVDMGILMEVEQRDRELLDCLGSGDRTGLLEHVAEDNNARNICGLPAMFAQLWILGEKQAGHLVHYGQWLEEPTRSAVTYTAMVLSEENSK